MFLSQFQDNSSWMTVYCWVSITHEELSKNWIKNIQNALFLLFTHRKKLLMKNENEASVPEFSSWILSINVSVLPCLPSIQFWSKGWHSQNPYEASMADAVDRVVKSQWCKSKSFQWIHPLLSKSSSSCQFYIIYLKCNLVTTGRGFDCLEVKLNVSTYISRRYSMSLIPKSFWTSATLLNYPLFSQSWSPAVAGQCPFPREGLLQGRTTSRR